MFDGHAPVKVITRFGTMRLSRRVCYHRELGKSGIPVNAVLPVHKCNFCATSAQSVQNGRKRSFSN